MFGWLFKKGDASGAGSREEPPASPMESFLEEERPAPAPPEEPKRPAPAPPPELIGEIPVAPPSSDDWSDLLSTTETLPVPAAPPPSGPPPSTPSGPGQSPPNKTSSGRIVMPALAQTPGKPSDPGATPNLLVPGVQLRAIPEKQPNTPRGWNVKVLKVEGDSIWLARIPGEDEPLPVAPKEILSLVIFDERQQVTYECPVLKVKAGNPETVMVGRPLKSTQEKSKLDSIGGRQHYRIATQLPVEVKIPGLPGKGIPPLSGHTRDISRGGLALVVNRGFDQGRELDVRVLSWNFPLQVRARVIRCDEESHGKFVIAVAFPEDMSAITRDLVGHFIMENQRGR